MISSSAIMEESDKCVKKIEIETIKEKLKLLPDTVIAGRIFELELDELDEYFVEKAKKELREKPEIIAQGFKEIKELIAADPDLYLPEDDNYYRIFLRPCKWYAQSAFSLMKRYFRFKLNYPHIFVGLLPSREKEAFVANLVCPLADRNKDGSRILIIEGGRKWKPKEVSLNQIFKAVILTLEAALIEQKTQVAGARIIIDMEGLSLSQVTYFSPSFAKMVVDFVQKCLPLRVKSIHIINQPFIFNMVFAFFKPFLEEKIRNRIHFHGTNRESLFAFIDKSILFTKYGGELELCEDFGSMLWQKICACEEVYKITQEYGYKAARNQK